MSPNIDKNKYINKNHYIIGIVSEKKENSLKRPAHFGDLGTGCPRSSAYNYRHLLVSFAVLFLLFISTYLYFSPAMDVGTISRIDNYALKSCKDLSCVTFLFSHLVITWSLYSFFDFFCSIGSCNLVLLARIYSFFFISMFLLATAWIVDKHYDIGRLEKKTIPLLIVFGSPGIFQLGFMLEDNIFYWPFVLLFYFFYVRVFTHRSSSLNICAVSAGLLLGLAVTINHTNIVFVYGLIASLPVVVLLKRWRPLRAITVIVVGATLIVQVTYLFSSHLPQIPGNPFTYYFIKIINLPANIGKHPIFLWPDYTPIFGKQYFIDILYSVGQLIVGEKVFLSLYDSDITKWPILVLLVVWFSLFFISPIVVFIKICKEKKTQLLDSCFVVLTYMIALFFPLAYETSVIERWDLLWFINSLIILTILESKKLPAFIKQYLRTLIIIQIAVGAISNYHYLTIITS